MFYAFNSLHKCPETVTVIYCKTVFISCPCHFFISISDHSDENYIHHTCSNSIIMKMRVSDLAETNPLRFCQIKGNHRYIRAMLQTLIFSTFLRSSMGQRSTLTKALRRLQSYISQAPSWYIIFVASFRSHRQYENGVPSLQWCLLYV